jgi:hypothetical protein
MAVAVRGIEGGTAHMISRSGAALSRYVCVHEQATWYNSGVHDA